MKVRVRLLGQLEHLWILEGEKEVHVNFAGDTVEDLLRHFVLNIGPEKKGIFINDQGKISQELLVFINGRRIADSNPFSQLLSEGDFIELAIAPG